MNSEVILKGDQVYGLGPGQLVRYVGYGYKNPGIAVIGLHISQLASLVGITPIVNEKPQLVLPFSFIQPRSVDNIHHILSAAQRQFAGSGHWC